MSVLDDASSLASDAGLQEAATRLFEVAEQDLGPSVSDAVLQSALVACIRIYGQKFEAGQRPRPLGDAKAVDATTLLLAVTALLRNANLELFELGMWQTFSGIR